MTDVDLDYQNILNIIWKAGYYLKIYQILKWISEVQLSFITEHLQKVLKIIVNSLTEDAQVIL